MLQHHGKLTVHCKEAHLKFDVDENGKQDPYVRIVFKGVNHETKVDHNGGHNPKWHEKIMDDVHVHDKDDEVWL